jgi:hypothetical protein
MSIPVIIGWVFTSIFILAPIVFFLGSYLTRDKSAEEAKAKKPKKLKKGEEAVAIDPVALEAEDDKFVFGKKENQKDLITTSKAKSDRSEQAAGVFGFGKGNTGFQLPPQGELVGNEKNTPHLGSEKPVLPQPPAPTSGSRPLPPPPPSLK